MQSDVFGGQVCLILHQVVTSSLSYDGSVEIEVMERSTSKKGDGKASASFQKEGLNA